MTIGIRHRCNTTLLIVGLVAIGAALSAAQVTPSDDPLFRSFSKEVDAYAQLRSRLEEPLPPFTPSRSAWSTLIAKQYLASATRAARRNEGQGHIFAPAVATVFLERIAKGLTPAERLLLGGGEDAAATAPTPRVNEPVPDEWMAAAPSALLQNSPELPAAVEYRFVGNDLILWDTHADIVIDVLPDALR